LIPSWPKTPDPSGNSRSQEDINYNRMSWGFISFAVGALTMYLVVVGNKVGNVLKDLSEAVKDMELEELDVSEGETPE
jgi:hypothetical protein